MFGIVYLLMTYDQIMIGYDHFSNVLNDHKPIFICFTKKGSLFPAFFTSQFQLTKCRNLRIFYQERKNFSVADKLSQSLTQKELKLNHFKHKQLPPQILFATTTHDNQKKPVHYPVGHETALLSQKDDCHPFLADFGTDQFSDLVIERGENTKIKPLASFSSEAVDPFQSH